MCNCTKNDEHLFIAFIVSLISCTNKGLPHL